MSEKFKKIEKEFLLSDSSLNAYKYRLLTAGYLMSEFAKNPIGYWMHGETTEFPREQGVLVKWESLRVEGDCVYGTPCINLNHPRGQRTADEIENGFLNAASMGHFNVIEVSQNPDDYLDGQTGVTVSKWFNRECSLVDVPGNFNALTSLYDTDNNPLKLEDLIANTKINKMEKIFLTPEQLGLMNLSATADANAVNTAFKNLVAEAAKVPTLTQNLAAANTAKETAETELRNVKAEAVKTEVANLVAAGLAEGKFTKETSLKLAADYATNPDGLKGLIAVMPKFKSVVEEIETGAEATELRNLVAKSWTDLDKAGELPRLKALNLDEFKSKYKSEFKKDYAG